MRAIRKLLIGTTALAGAGYGAAYYAFPEVRNNQAELLKATQRAARFYWAAGRLAYIYKFSSASEEEQDEWGSEILYDAFMKNGGLSIKLGQSIGASQGHIPEPYTSKMARFYQNAKESSYENVRKQIEESTGQKLEDIFQDFDPKPISAASIAQVHIAHLKNGQKVAVKVQHRGLKEQYYVDLGLILYLTQIAEIVFPGFKYKWYGEELNRILPKELNFHGEAKNAERTQKLFENNSSIRVPNVYKEYSNDKVLVMEYVEGVAIHKTKEIRDMGINTKDVAKLLNHCFSQQIFEFGHVHGDPHPGNIFVSPHKDFSGKIRPVITLLDHGLYQDLSEDVRINYSYLWKGILTRDDDMIREAAKGLNVEKLYQIFAMAVARKDYQQIMNTKEKDTEKRLKAPTKQEQLEQMEKFHKMDPELKKELTHMFSQMNKDIFLLFKVNDIIRVITTRLGAPVKQFEIMAKYCFNTVEKNELQTDAKFSKKFMLWFQRTSTLLSLQMYGIYYSIMSFFKTPEIPDRVILNY